MLTAYRTHVGRVRHVNEDHAWIGRLGSSIALAIVADGMGGHLAGDVASGMAVEAFRSALEQYSEKTAFSEEEAKMLMRQAISAANESIHAMASKEEKYHNMGTTIVAALLQRGRAVVGHVGDSRAYRLGKDSISLLTEDHSLVNELLRSGQLNPEEAAHHPRRNVLTRAVGTDARVDIDVNSLPWAPDDVLLLCSDGLSNLVNEGRMLETMTASGWDLEAGAEQLIQLALEAGGDDNVTVVLLRLDAGEREENEL
ncbi:Stp1/IreP family PP2C-type Ser/Thr phosphatase [Paenibacillus chungangensis]|uniref:Stp1/IreP family PP2C-type Ser/Thr phosphatase n=1 Tax=Paenibacillus chungangensis TaxID=696535 RepID=A0ABW3HPC6_9BACL